MNSKQRKAALQAHVVASRYSASMLGSSPLKDQPAAAVVECEGRMPVNPIADALKRDEYLRAQRGYSRGPVGVDGAQVGVGVVGQVGGSRSVKPPVGNTGGSVSTSFDLSTVGGVRIDWFNATFLAASMDAVRAVVSDLEGEFRKRPLGLHGYAESEETITGVVMAYTPGRREALISLCGTCATLTSLAKFIALCDVLADLDARCSRIDVAYDETDGLLDVRKVARAAKRGKFVGFKKYKVVEGSDGMSVYFGRRGQNGGTKVACIYDKAAEQKLAGVHWTRIEIRFQKDGAHLVWHDFVRRVREGQAFSEIQSALCRWIAGALDFRQDGDGCRNLERRPRLAFWQKVVDRLGEPHKLSLPPKKTTVEAFCAWFTASIAPSLSFARILAESYGDDFALILKNVLDSNEYRVRWSRADARLAGLTRERLLASFNNPHWSRPDVRDSSISAERRKAS